MNIPNIRTHDPSVRASEDSSCVRAHGHCNRRLTHCTSLKSLKLCILYEYRHKLPFSMFSVPKILEVLSYIEFVTEMYRVGGSVIHEEKTT
jgi:hypothetical protein